MRLFIAGSSGQVARALLERANATDNATDVDAVAFGRPALDLADADSIARLAEAMKPGDIVVNAAAYTAVDNAEEDAEAARAINAVGAGRLAACADAAGLPFIHLSTDYVFNGEKKTSYTENDNTAPLGVYGQTKLEGEERVAAAASRTVILRTAWVYSPFGKNFLKTMLRLAGERDTVGVVADQFGTPTNALDIADGVIAVARRLSDDPAAPAGVFHMTSNGEASWADFAEAIFSASRASGGPTASVNRITTAEFPTPAKRPENSRLNCDKLADAYDVRLPDWRDAVAPITARVLSEANARSA